MNRDPVPLLSDGMFIVLGSETAWLALVEIERRALYYDGLTIAETRVNHVTEYVAQIVREFFGRDAVQALPAPTFEALAFYLEHYDGRLRERVQQLAALLLSGRVFDTGTDEGGQTVAPAAIPESPTPPTGATFDITSDVPVAEAVA